MVTGQVSSQVSSKDMVSSKHVVSGKDVAPGNDVVSSNDVGSFLAVFAALLLDNVLRLDETVGKVTDLVIGSGRPDNELIVALQSFDRLKQEFEARV